MSQCSLTFPPFKKLSVHEHYETKIDQEIVYLIISGVSNLLTSGEESKHTKKILKRVIVDQRVANISHSYDNTERGSHGKHGQCELLYSFFHGIIQPFKLFRTTCKGESRNRVFDRSDRIYIYITDIIYTAYTCNTG